MQPTKLTRSLRTTFLWIGFMFFAIAMVHFVQRMAHAEYVTGQRSIALFSGHAKLATGYTFSLFSDQSAAAGSLPSGTPAALSPSMPPRTAPTPHAVVQPAPSVARHTSTTPNNSQTASANTTHQIQITGSSHVKPPTTTNAY